MVNGTMQFLVLTHREDGVGDMKTIITIDSNDGETTVTFGTEEQYQSHSGIVFVADSYEITKQSAKTPATETFPKQLVITYPVIKKFMTAFFMTTPGINKKRGVYQ